MILLIGHIDIDPAAADGFGETIVRQVEASRAEDGCISYALSFDPTTPGRINVAELWRDQAALDAHRVADHMNVWRGRLAEIGGAARHIDQYEVDPATRG